jgi:hypothetical protein
MIFAATQLEGAWLIDLDPRENERGFFARVRACSARPRHRDRPGKSVL